jgi:hypothetical protein
VLDVLEQLRAAAGWPARKFAVCETHCTGLLWCLRHGLTMGGAIDAVRAMAWVHAVGPENVSGGQMAEPTTVFGERTQGDERRLRMGKQVDRWIAAGRPEPSGRPAAVKVAAKGVMPSGFRREAVEQ